MIKELVTKNRSYRRFYGDKTIELETLRELVDLARLSPSGRNVQGLKYMLFNSKEDNAKISENIFWAGYLKDWDGPIDSEKPSAYIVMFRDTTLGNPIPTNEGIALQTMLLGAVEQGLGGCIIGNINRVKLKEELGFDDSLELAYVLALGYPKEEVVIEEMNESKDIKYWRDENNVHHVPKRSLDELILN
ncbi:MAG: nitroreductase family protein [Clostridium sp.]|nr:nitroreductase family protein [Clostridium sp.]